MKKVNVNTYKTIYFLKVEKVEKSAKSFPRKSDESKVNKSSGSLKFNEQIIGNTKR